MNRVIINSNCVGPCHSTTDSTEGGERPLSRHRILHESFSEGSHQSITLYDDSDDDIQVIEEPVAMKTRQSRAPQSASSSSELSLRRADDKIPVGDAIKPVVDDNCPSTSSTMPVIVDEASTSTQQDNVEGEPMFEMVCIFQQKLSTV